ncbi:MipA/OmpV family protein [Oceanicoccus sagamiensis]|uniref:MipA/OmpV family protein n=1 Tax=Oceanicoccus sagamiensis TaxID=716816 RepID=A0A1X9NDY7_9GAMM|nr:MipA/OmpV family protein [Oceanicoccus sagamiensis]ARN75274.1 hypothetical protein BST96_14825 [Oceanicoccus sagamiensis]
MRIIITLWLLLLSVAVVAEEQPKWEAGIGAAGLYHPHYLGADQEKGYLLPLPYFTYRGEMIRADRGGLRGFIYDSEKLDLNLSVSGSLPVNSEDNDAREGMDDLDIMLEVGPTLQYLIHKDDNHRLRADFPVRGGFTFGDDIARHQGWTSNPRMHYERFYGPWTITSTLGPVFSDRRYHGYVYNVEQAFVTEDRAFYKAKSGYTAGRFSLSLKRRIGDYFIGGKVSYYNLDGAANEDSPLVKKNEYFGFSLIFAWVFSESNEMVAD